MSDIKFACPHCQQHIQCEPSYAGMQIPCPACRGNMVVPGQAPAAAPPPPRPVVLAAAQAPVPVPAPAAAPAPAGGGCPGCGAPLPHGVMICTRCGYSRATGRRMPIAGATAGVARRKSAGGWTQNPVVWASVGVVLFGLSFLARVSTIGLLVYLVAGGLFCAAVHITVLVFAFGEDVGTGVLTLCFWPYAVYFVYFKNENTGLKVFYAIGFMVGASFKLLKVPLVDG